MMTAANEFFENVEVVIREESDSVEIIIEVAPDRNLIATVRDNSGEIVTAHGPNFYQLFRELEEVCEEWVDENELV